MAEVSGMPLGITPRLVRVPDSDQRLPPWSEVLPAWQRQLLLSTQQLTAMEPRDGHCLRETVWFIIAEGSNEHKLPGLAKANKEAQFSRK